MVRDDVFWMQEALKLAQQAASHQEVPVGAVLVGDHHQLLGQGNNRVIQSNDPTAHAEILAIQQGAQTLRNYRLLNTTLYVTLEPCCMCAGAMVHARIDRLVFATRDFKAGAAGSVYNLLQGYPLNHRIRIDEGVLQAECAHVLTDFFSERK